MMRFGVAVSAMLAGAGAAGDASPHDIKLTLTEGNRQSLAIQLDAEQSMVVSSIADGQLKEAGVELGDRLVSANGETADKKSNYWLITNIDKRPVDFVFRKGKTADKDCPEAIHASAYEYVEKGEVLKLRQLLEEFKCDVNLPGPGQLPLIHVAATKGKIAAIKILAFYGAKVDVEVDGNRPIHIASELGNTFAVHVLVEEGVDMDKKNKQGLTPFHLAVHNGHTEPMKVLRKATQNGKKCDWLAKTAAGKTTYELAKEGDDEAVISLMDAMLKEQSEHDAKTFTAVLKGEEL